jgi:hypothetical protein
MATRRGRIVFAIGAVLFGAATFLLASGYVIERGQPKWLAAVAGGLAFPVLPVVWHLWAERRRKARIAAAKTPPKSELAPGDRYVLRAIVVALAVIGPMVAVGRFAVVRAAWTHKTWFIPEPEGAYFEGGGNASKSELLSHVPSDAEVVIVVSDNDAKGKGVFAFGDHQLLAIAPRDKDDKESISDKVDQINKDRGKIPFLKLDPVVEVSSASDDMVVIAGERWKSKVAVASVGPSAAVRAELDRAPAGATAVGAYVPATPIMGIKRAAGWLIASEAQKKIIVDARVEAVDVKAAESLLREGRAAWTAKASEVPAKCREQVDAIVEDVKVERTGAVFTFHLEIAPEKLMGVMFCGLKTDGD